jgi:hypothetical protein
VDVRLALGMLLRRDAQQFRSVSSRRHGSDTTSERASRIEECRVVSSTEANGR